MENFPLAWQLPGSPDQSPFFFEAHSPKNLGTPFDADLCAGASRDVKQRMSESRRNLFRSMLPASDDDEIDASLSVSRTRLFDRTRRESDPNRYIDGMELPYLTLPLDRLSPKTGVQLGDAAVAINPRTNKLCFALVGDTRDGLVVDTSLFLAEALEIAGDEAIVYLVFPGTGDGQGTIPAIEQIQARGERLFYREIGRSWSTILTNCFADHLDEQRRPVDQTLAPARVQKMFTLQGQNVGHL